MAWPMEREERVTCPTEVRLTELSDAQLMAEIQEGHMALLGELYNRHQRTVKAALRHFVPEMNGADIDDVTQDVFIAVGHSAARYEEQSKFKAWLYHIVARKSVSWRRKTFVRRRFIERRPGPAALAFEETRCSPEDKTSLRQIIGKMLVRLPDDLREALWLHFVEGFDGEEIATILNVRRATVYTRLHRARKMLMENIHAPQWQQVLHEEIS